MKGTPKTILLIMMLFYVLFLAKIIAFRHYSLDEIWLNILDFRLSNIPKGWEQANLIPFRSGIDYLFFTNVPLSFKTEQILSNLIAFAPLGAFGPILWDRLGKAGNMLLLVLLLSFAFELMQWAFRLGVFDVDHIMLNLAGCMAGFLPIKMLGMAGGRLMAGQKAKM